jgi:hypothetical protein
VVRTGAVVATYRDAELEAAAHPGRPHLLPLLGRATQLRLTGLDHDGVQELLARAGRDLDHAAVAEVLRRTGGNPFFVEQTALLDGAPSAGVRAGTGVGGAVRAEVLRLSAGPRLS